MTSSCFSQGLTSNIFMFDVITLYLVFKYRQSYDLYWKYNTSKSQIVFVFFRFPSLGRIADYRQVSFFVNSLFCFYRFLF